MDSDMEAMRKVVQINLSPIRKKTYKDLRYECYMDFNRFRTNKKILARDINIESAYILIGCIYSRLCYLIEKHEYLEDFYDYVLEWCTNQKWLCRFKTSQRFELMILHHYVNFLRAIKKYDKAIKSIIAALDFYNKIEINVDTVYKINLELQKKATSYDKEMYISKKSVGPLKLRRALEFKLSPENIKDQDRCGRTKMLTNQDNVLRDLIVTNVVDLNQSQKTIKKCESALSKKEPQSPIIKESIIKSNSKPKLQIGKRDFYNSIESGVNENCVTDLHFNLCEVPAGENEYILPDNAANLNTKKHQIASKPINVKPNKKKTNMRPLVHLNAKMDSLRLLDEKSSAENFKKEVSNYVNQAAPNVNLQGTQNKITKEIATEQTPIRSKRITRQQSKILN